MPLTPASATPGNPLLRSTGHDEVLDLLHQRRIDVHAVTGVFIARQPLHWCAYWTWPDVAREVLAQGAAVDAPGEPGETALSIAIAHADRGDVNPDLVRLLLQAGADMDRPNEDGVSPWDRIQADGPAGVVAIFQAHRVIQEQALLRATLDQAADDGRAPPLPTPRARL